MDHSHGSEEKRAIREANEAKLVGLWSRFKKKFRTDLDCFKELYKIGIRENILLCNICGSQLEIDSSYRILSCSCCCTSCALTAGTLFAGARKIKAWLGAIWVMERGAILTSSRFSKLAGIAQSSALNILRKVRMAIERNLQTEAQEVHSSLFRLIVCKRSRETPARAHPIEEEEELAKSRQEEPPINEPPSAPSPDANEQPEAGGELQGAMKKIFDVLTNEPLSPDDLCNLTGLSPAEVGAELTFLELDRLVTQRDGDRYVRQTTQGTEKSRKPNLKLDAQARQIVEFIMAFIYDHFHGSSRKYLQNYASAHWWHSHRHHWRFGKLIKVCLLTEPITYNDIIAYVTPPAVKI